MSTQRLILKKSREDFDVKKCQEDYYVTTIDSPDKKKVVGNENPQLTLVWDAVLLPVNLTYDGDDDAQREVWQIKM